MTTMKLEKYLKKTKITKTKFAQVANISRETLYNLLEGGMPNIRTLHKIIRASKGAVTFDDF